LLKQNRVLINSDNHQHHQHHQQQQTSPIHVNNWCMQLLSEINARTTQSSSDLTMVNESLTYWCNTNGITSTTTQHSNPTIENALKLIQINAQFVHFLMQSVFDFESLNSQLETTTSVPSELEIMSSQSLSVIEKMGSRLKKVDQKLSLFSDMADFVKKLIKLFFHFVNAFFPTSETLSSSSEIDSNETTASTDSNAAPKTTTNAANIENKQPIQIFITLLDILSALFTRVKVQDILNEFLFHFADSIEYLSQLGAISRKQYHQPQPLAISEPNGYMNSFFETFKM
jgi:hypothetical protein